jgi:predicted XRE-type DNA-binding protein
MAKSTYHALIVEGSGNPFTDLGFDEPELELSKAAFIMEMAGVIRARRMSAAKAARLMGISQASLAGLLRGHWKGCSLERLVLYLNKLGVTVRLSLERNPKTGTRGELVVSRRGRSAMIPKSPA